MREATQISSETATIATGQTKTGNIATCNKLIGLIVPSTWNGTNLTFEAATSAGGTYYPVRQPDDIGDLVTIAATASTYIPFNVTEMFAFQYFRLVSDTVAASNIVFTLIYK
jgi:hypothetical protein